MTIDDKIKQRLGSKIIEWKDVSARRAYFTVRKEDIFETVKFLFRELQLRFSTASATDTPQNFEILYHFSEDKGGKFYSVRVFIEDKKHPEIDSITPLFPGAEWIEREMWEMLGVNFKGHPNLKRLLLAEDWPEGEYPLRHEHEP
ncbi:MAG: NADH-quinone oxidoreductase subunit C [Deltaproteobacteria bacterium]